MKKIYQIISILLAMCLLTSIVGCRKKEQKADAKYTIYQINQSGTALVPKDYDGTGKSVDEEKNSDAQNARVESDRATIKSYRF